MTAVDILLMAPLMISALNGIRRGFLLGAADLASIAVSLLVAGSTFSPLAGQLSGIIGGAANATAFSVIFVLVQIGLGLFVIPRLRPVRLAFPTPIRWIDDALGTIPGALKGLALVGVVILCLGIWPTIRPARDVIAQSKVGTNLLPIVGRSEPWAAELVSRLALPLPAAIVEPGSTVPIPGSSWVQPDPNSEDQLVRLVNEERERFGLQPLVVDALIRKVARAYSEELFRAGRFSHDSPTAGTPFDRLKAGGVEFSLAGENLAYAPTVETAHAGLMASAGHRANVLSPRYRRIGIGVAVSPGLGRVFTQDFAD